MKRSSIIIGSALLSILAVAVWHLTETEREIRRLHRDFTSANWPVEAYRYDPSIGFEPTPGVYGKVRDGKFTFSTHALGYRVPLDADRNESRPGGVLSLGCSFTYGDEVNAEDTFTHRLGELLGLPAYNFGVCSYSYVSSLLRLEKLERTGVLKELSPSIILLGAGKWLYRRSTSPYYPTGSLQFAYSYLGRDGEGLAIKPPPEDHDIKHMMTAREAYFGERGRDGALTPERRALLKGLVPRVSKAREAKREITSRSPDVPERDLYEFLLPKFHEISSRIGARFVVLWMPRSAEQKPPTVVAEIMDELPGALLVDGMKALERIGFEDLFQPEGIHYNRRTHYAMAELIAVELRRGGSQESKHERAAEDMARP